MPAVQTEPIRIGKRNPQLRVPAIYLVAGFSILYFADVFLRASEKYFWYDELFTVYLCRLPLRSLWHALQAGIDSNPPLFYALTKASDALFGEGLFGTRMPEILAFWIFSVSLFYFVKRRAGVMAGFVAMVLPIFTGAFYYAYEARPHGMVLGFCGLALICWQMSIDQPRANRWLVGFSLALFGAFMTHCYAVTIAVPFGIAELVRGIQLRRVEWRRWLAMIAPGVIAGLTYLPLLIFYRSAVKGTIFLTLSPLVLRQIPSYYGFLLGPCTLVLLIVVALLALKARFFGRSHRDVDREVRWILLPEIIAALSFLVLPLFGLIIAKLLHSPFYDRYFLSALAGVCILVGFGVGNYRTENWAASVLAGVMALSLLVNIGHVVRHRLENEPETLVEPSSGFSENVSLAGPMENYSLLRSAPHNDEPIIVFWPIEFLYVVNYAPDLTPRLYYVGWNDEDSFYRLLSAFQAWSPVKYNTMKADDFFRRFPRFLLYAPDSIDQLAWLNKTGASISFVRADDGHYLADLEFDRIGPAK